jgi:ubiquinone/menaquinone biosynthesis C-methylase UbiE
MKTMIKNKVLLKVLLLVIFFCLLFSVSMSIAQDRDSWQQPERVMDIIGVKPGMTIGEVGAGRGYFTFMLSRRVGIQGKIYANDIDQEALASIESRCRGEGITNVEIILGKIDDPCFPEGKMDMVFMSFVFHLLEKPVELLKNLKPSMKPGASLIIIDSRKAKMTPQVEKRKVIEPVVEAGFKLFRKETFLDRANIYIFQQKETVSK